MCIFSDSAKDLEQLSLSSKPYALGMAAEPLSLSTKTMDLTSKFIAPALPKEPKKHEEALDFSGKHSPSVSVHIVKSPGSAMVNPSPHSASPCITDDELMDEALVGMGK